MIARIWKLYWIESTLFALTSYIPSRALASKEIAKDIRRMYIQNLITWELDKITKVNIVWLRLLSRLTLLEPTCLCSAVSEKNGSSKGAQVQT